MNEADPTEKDAEALRIATSTSSLDFSGLPGLRESEAAARLDQEGPNELPTQKKRGLLSIALEVVREPMFLMLVAAGVLYLLMGEPADALMLLGFVFVVMGITIIQERRTERALDALRDLSSPRALVIRDGLQRRVPGRDVVRGDLVVLSEGDRVTFTWDRVAGSRKDSLGASNECRPSETSCDRHEGVPGRRGNGRGHSAGPVL